MASAAVSAGSGVEISDVGKAEREAIEKHSLMYVRKLSASPARFQSVNDAAPQLGLGLATGTRLRARLESAASTAVRAPVLAVIEYNYERWTNYCSCGSQSGRADQRCKPFWVCGPPF